MQPRTLDQINASLGSIYDPQVQAAQQQLAALPAQQKADQAGLQAQQQQSFQDILNGARSRGVGIAFGGIPLQEQAQYTATKYLPALADLDNTYAQKTSGLQDAINKINEQRYTQAQGEYQYENDLAEKQREFNDNMALQRQQAAASAAQPSLGDVLGQYLKSQGSNTPTSLAGATQRADKGFNFTDANGNSISAAAYAHATNTPFRDLLQRMAKAGDQGAAQALGFVGNDFGYDPNKVNNQNAANLYNSLTWGTGRQAKVYQQPQQIAQNNIKSLAAAQSHPIWQQFVNPVNWL